MVFLLLKTQVSYFKAHQLIAQLQMPNSCPSLSSNSQALEMYEMREANWHDSCNIQGYVAFPVHNWKKKNDAKTGKMTHSWSGFRFRVELGVELKLFVLGLYSFLSPNHK